MKDDIDAKNENSFHTPRVNHAHHTNGELFRRSPIDPSGRCIDLSDSSRPLLCASSNMRNEVVIGGSDHALYSIDVLDERKKVITMYTKICGHTDWVTSVAHLSTGQVISGAMDGKLCLWSATSRSHCIELARESTHPISKIVADTRYNNAICCSYDGNIEIYSFSGDEYGKSTPSSSSSSSLSRRVKLPSSKPTRTPSASSILTGHTQPVLECSYHHNVLASGDKGGSLMIWNLATGQPLHRFRAHPAAVTAIHCCPEGSIILTTGTDGYVKVWDPRSSGSGLVQKIPAHVQSAPINQSRVGPTGRSQPVRGSSGGRGTLTSGRASIAAGTPSTTASPISVMAVNFSRGSNSDINYIVTGGGSPDDSRLCLIDTRKGGAFEPVASWDHHRNGIYSLCLVGDDTILSGDGMGTLLCHHILDGTLHDSRSCLKYGIGSSSTGAVRAIHCIGGKVVTANEDGKALIIDYE